VPQGRERPYCAAPGSPTEAAFGELAASAPLPI